MNASRSTSRIPEVKASPDQRFVTAVVDVNAPPDRVFEALASAEVTDWWVRPGIFDTRDWTGDVQPGGYWHASGIGQGSRTSLRASSRTSTGLTRSLTHGTS